MAEALKQLRSTHHTHSMPASEVSQVAKTAARNFMLESRYYLAAKCGGPCMAPEAAATAPCTQCGRACARIRRRRGNPARSAGPCPAQYCRMRRSQRRKLPWHGIWGPAAAAAAI